MSIELKNVTKRFGDTAAVNNVSFSIKEGELVALLGPSGGGKTTVLRMIAGLEVPTTGDIFIRGRRVNDVPVQQRNIGFVFQSYALFKNMNVFKNIAFGLKVKKWKRRDIGARVAELLRLFGLDGLEKRFPHQLSGGQRQRVAIARALVLEPRAVLLDEPLANLDIGLRRDLLALFRELLTERHVPALFVTHDPREAASLGDRVAVIENGRVVQSGTVADLEAKPATAFVESFVADLKWRSERDSNPR